MNIAPGVLDRLCWRLGLFAPSSPVRVHGRILAGVVLYHSFALLALFPYFFSWTAVAAFVLGIVVFANFGINAGYHRLLTHRGFCCPVWLERTLAILGTCNWQGTPINWVAIHRRHHQHSDDADDPHSPIHSFFWSHMGWFLSKTSAFADINTYEHYARDLVSIPFYRWLERSWVWWMIHAVQWTSLFGLGTLLGLWMTGTTAGALQLGASWLVWGVFVRTVFVWHSTWSVNSITHMWGYRNYPSRDDSRNNWIVALLSSGEGWHNNHHAEPRAAAHGHRWWELDFTYRFICLWERLGLAWNVVRPRILTRPEVQPQAERRRAA